jgi:hypothetical protein
MTLSTPWLEASRRLAWLRSMSWHWVERKVVLHAVDDDGFYIGELHRSYRVARDELSFTSELMADFARIGDTITLKIKEPW